MPERGVAGARPTEVTVKTLEMFRGLALSLRPPPGLQRLKAPSFQKKKQGHLKPQHLRECLAWSVMGTTAQTWGTEDQGLERGPGIKVAAF